MSLSKRLWIAIPLGVVLMGAIIPIYGIGLFLGVMGTDSCSSLPDWLSLHLLVLWPLVMLATAVVPPVLIVKQARGWRVLLALGIGLALSAGCYLSWIPMLTAFCK